MDEERTGMERSLLLVVVVSLVVQTSWDLLVASTPLRALGWVSAAGISFLVLAVFLLVAGFSSHGFFARLLLFGVVAGFVELYADAWVISGLQCLDYPSPNALGHEAVQFWESPFYMPFAWTVVLVEMAFIGWRLPLFLVGRWGWVRGWRVIALGTVLCFLLGLSLIPLYEGIAKFATWWFYDCSVVSCFRGTTPWLIIIGEGLLAAPLPLFAHLLVRRSWLTAVALGILEGVIIWGAYVLGALMT